MARGVYVWGHGYKHTWTVVTYCLGRQKRYWLRRTTISVHIVNVSVTGVLVRGTEKSGSLHAVLGHSHMLEAQCHVYNRLYTRNCVTM